jgi:hypothetical protein
MACHVDEVLALPLGLQRILESVIQPMMTETRPSGSISGNDVAMSQVSPEVSSPVALSTDRHSFRMRYSQIAGIFWMMTFSQAAQNRQTSSGWMKSVQSDGLLNETALPSGSAGTNLRYASLT